MNVIENLYDYLKTNDKAELIGFGTFYVKNSSAKINDLTGTIEPPKRELFFTREQSGDTGFVSFMASNEFINEQTAYTWIKQYSDSLKDKIQQGRQVTLGKLGKIEKGLLEDYSFTPSDELNLLGNSFALGTLKNVQTFDSVEEDVELIHTKPQQDNIVSEPNMPKEFEDKKSEIELQIENARRLKEEERILETDKQTEQRIIQHSEAIVENTIEKPENITEDEFKINTDNSTKEDKTEQTIDRAAEFKENIVVEDIKKADNEDYSDRTAAERSRQEDVLLQKAEEIVKKHSSKKDKVKKEKRTNVRKKRWLILLWIIAALLVLCIAFVCMHWLGLLKNIEVLKPVTDKLSYYIPVRETKVVNAEQPLAETMTESLNELSDADEDFYEKEEIIEEPLPVRNLNTVSASQSTKLKTAKAQKQKETKQENVTPPQEENVVVDNTPVIVQNHSKLGFDVVSGAYSDKAKAQEQAQKAKRLGYDGYVITKIKGGTPIYYASYGSRRTQSDATDLCTLIKNRLGGDFYIISR
ncbi:MAG: SPOR domain-containing protein [Bacteroidales bacterium]|nr:SPOR domain-containing protein [Bacteroidales bacterium]